MDSILLAIVQFELLLEVAKDWSSHLPPLTSPLVKPDLSFFAMKNTRRKMEDRHALCLDVNALFRLKVDESMNECAGVIDAFYLSELLVHVL